MGNSWTQIAALIPGRRFILIFKYRLTFNIKKNSENESKNRWYSKAIKRKIAEMEACNDNNDVRDSAKRRNVIKQNGCEENNEIAISISDIAYIREATLILRGLRAKINTNEVANCNGTSNLTSTSTKEFEDKSFADPRLSTHTSHDKHDTGSTMASSFQLSTDSSSWKISEVGSLNLDIFECLSGIKPSEDWALTNETTFEYRNRT